MTASPSHPTIEPQPQPQVAQAHDGEPPPQQCGRCRLFFEGDPTLNPAAQAGWWLCPPCRSLLLPNRTR